MAEHDEPEPYDICQPFDPDQLLDGFTEELEQVIRASDDPVLGELAERACAAWAAFLATDDESP